MIISSIGNLPELSGLYALLGFVLLFAVLIGATFLVKTLLAKRKPTSAEPVAPTAAEPIAEEPAPGRSGDMILYNVSEREAAMVMAIVADELGTPINQLDFISIKKKCEEDCE